ncbi:hypothetical protein ACFQ1E_17065 [Sphingomonas canadensis]|uniref:Uncharacterized protein n=1 Tax=Sphingomonas canadensis TaxID=1219257 RepID=A0ABW3HA72_9SPHN|nr:hypothetical protein [Sphingomonas canadensis]MCW3837758.1 hypothetical protein [Sphingomonas canadensis]
METQTHPRADAIRPAAPEHRSRPVDAGIEELLAQTASPAPARPLFRLWGRNGYISHMGF